MKKKLTTFVLLVLCAVMLLSSVAALAVEPYQTYTYASDGYALYSPAAYSPYKSVDSNYMGLSTSIGTAADLCVGPDESVYISDSKNNRVIVLDRYYKHKYTITNFYNDQGVYDSFNSPSGLYATDDALYVCDTKNYRIVKFDLKGNFVSVIKKPESKLFGDDDIYNPVAVAVDHYGRIFVVSATTYQGVIVMTEDGTFSGFIGAQKAVYTVWEIIWRRFQTAEQRAASEKIVSTEFNNLTVNSDGFIFVTTSSIAEPKQIAAIKSKKSDYSPVKMLNSAGDEVMKRNGFFDPGGEVLAATGEKFYTIEHGASKIVDVAVGPENTWSIIDSKRSRVYTYDSNGNLLFAFGDTGDQLGNLVTVSAIDYQGSYMIILDKNSGTFTVYKRTEYGDLIIDALACANSRDYSESQQYWTDVLMRNNNFDAAYIGIGKSLYFAGEYKEAMKYLSAAYETEYYSKAYSEIRKDWIEKWILLIPIAVIGICVAWTFFMKFAKKVNYKTSITKGKRTYGQELIYVFHLVFHPFDGFWDLKHEKRGSLRAALTIFAVVVVSFFYQSIGSGYVMNTSGVYSSFMSQFWPVFLPVFLWALANWCLTTLFDGEGSFKDILIACCYSLAPLAFVLIPVTIFSNFVTISEVDILNVIIVVGYIWSGMLIFFGMMVTHDYSLGKNFITSLGTIVGMGLIMFIAILFTSLMSKILSFISSLAVEIGYRL